jgi:hypothetical protein
MCPKAQEEKYQEWLERLEIPIDKAADIETLRNYLKGEFGITTDAQVQALWDTLDIKDTLAEHGIHAVMVTYPWGKDLRYGVQGMPGLWGFEAVQTIMEEEEE